MIAERAKAAGINAVVFDRGGFLYHGRVKAVAEAPARAAWSSSRTSGNVRRRTDETEQAWIEKSEAHDDGRDGEGTEFEERVVQINRVAKVVKGGRRFSFGSIVVVGDGKGRVGVGMGKAGEVPGFDPQGRRSGQEVDDRVPLDGTTIPHEIEENFGASTVLLKPAAPGPA